MRVLLEKTTGKLIEMQSYARAGALIENIKANPQYGFTEAQVEEREVTALEWALIKNEWIDEPRRKTKETKDNALKLKETALRAKLGLSELEFKDLLDVVKG